MRPGAGHQRRWQDHQTVEYYAAGQRRRGIDPVRQRYCIRRRGRARQANATNVPFNPKLDTLVSYSMYSVIPSPVDDSVWGISEFYPGYLMRMQRGNNPPESCKTQLFKVPDTGLRSARRGYR